MAKLIFALMCLGAAAGLVLWLFGGVVRLLKNNFIVRFSADVSLCLLAGLGFIAIIFTLFDGQFAFFEVVALAFGFIIQQIFIKNTFAYLFSLVYNKVKRKRSEKIDPSKTC